MIISLVLFLLAKKNISVKDRTRLTNAILDKLGAIPVRDIISERPDGTLVVQGHPVDIEMARKLREGAISMLESSVRKIVREQVAFRAVTLGVHKAESPEQVLFAKSALWNAQQEDELYSLLAQQ